MSIVKMSRFELAVFESDRDKLLDRLQEFGIVHFSDLRTNPAFEKAGLMTAEREEEIQAAQAELARVEWMLKQIQPYISEEEQKTISKAGPIRLDFQDLVQKGQEIETADLYRDMKVLADGVAGNLQKISEIQSRLADLEPWKDLPIPLNQVEETDKLILWAGTMPKGSRNLAQEALKHLDLTDIVILSSGPKNDNVVVVTVPEAVEETRDVLQRAGFARIYLKGEGLAADLIASGQGQIEKLRQEIAEAEKGYQTYASHRQDLEIRHDYIQNVLLKGRVGEKLMRSEYVVMMEGYVPQENAQAFEACVEETAGGLYALKVTQAEEDNPYVPILLRNNKIVQAFENLVEMYALPRYDEIDPTPFLMPFYFMFFGMMSADIGYGLIVFIGATLLMKKVHLNKGTRDLVNMFRICSISTIIWGAFYASFLGGIIQVPWEPILDQNTDYMGMLIMAMGLGLVNILFGLGLKAYMLVREGKPVDALMDVGFWYMALLGAIVFLAGGMIGLSATVITIAKWVMIIGMVGIVLFSARNSTSPIGRLVGGLYDLYGISSYVGDLVSFSRLMALALSGAFIGVAVNSICQMLAEAGPVGIVGALIVFVVFHLFNAFLSYLSAYVHASRLIYVEFFGKYYEGGGPAFDRFRSQPKYIEYMD